MTDNIRIHLLGASSKPADALFHSNENGDGGYFPAGRNTFWHGGIHFSTTEPVTALWDGEIVAYRITENPIKQHIDGADEVFSNSFVLMKHSYETPKGQAIRFYSLYMHLLPLKSYTATQLHAAPSIFQQQRYVVKACPDITLAVLDATNADTILGYLRKGEEFHGTPQGPNTVLIQHHGQSAVVQIGNGRARGRNGRYKATPTPANTHPEERGLACKDAVDGPIRSLLPIGTTLLFKTAESRYTSSFLKKKTHAELDGGGFVLASPDTISATPVVTPIQYDTTVNLSPAIHIHAGTLLGYPGPYRHHATLVHVEVFTDDVSFLTNPKGDAYGLPHLQIAGNTSLFDRNQVTSGGSTTTTFQAQPDVTPSTSWVPALRRVLHDGATWYEIPRSPTRTAWINKGNAGILLEESAYKWPGFEKIQEDEWANYFKKNDAFLDATALLQRLDRNHDGSLDDADIRAAVRDGTLGPSLRQLVCLYPSEWDETDIEKKFSRLKEPPLRMKDEQFFEHILHTRKMCWWTTVSQKPQSNAWHLHPVAFIKHLRSLHGITREQIAKLITTPIPLYPSALPYRATFPVTRDEVAAIVERYLAPLNDMMERYEINHTRLRQCHFMAQVLQETNRFSQLSEGGNLPPSRNPNYETPAKYYDGEFRGDNDDYFDQYSDKLGNVDDLDSVKFRGRGLLHLTGRANYAEYWVYRGWLSTESFTKSWWNTTATNPIAAQIANPQIIAVDPYNACDSAGWYWTQSKRKCSGQSLTPQQAADTDNVSNVTCTVNGGQNGIDRRTQFLALAKSVLLGA